MAYNSLFDANTFYKTLVHLVCILIVIGKFNIIIFSLFQAKNDRLKMIPQKREKNYRLKMIPKKRESSSRREVVYSGGR